VVFVDFKLKPIFTINRTLQNYYILASKGVKSSPKIINLLLKGWSKYWHLGFEKERERESYFVCFGPFKEGYHAEN